MKASSLPDIERARFNMIEQQIRPCGVFDDSVLEALFSVRRELFVPAGCRSLAFSDMEIPPVSYTHLTLPTKRIV